MKYCKECNNYFEDDSLTVCPYCKDRQLPLYDVEKTEEKEMSPQKRTTVRILSAIALIILACLFIWGVDWLLGLLKGLF